ncbi:MAG: hypothetical protein GX638_15420 [Crenarchaeota archaeon]|nr:hypothetical protein [Thermoproteota archaeon]
MNLKSYIQRLLNLKKHSKFTFIFLLFVLIICAAFYTVLTQNESTVFATSNQIGIAQDNLIATEQMQKVSAQFSIDVIYAYVGPRTNYFTSGNPFSDEMPLNQLNAKSLYPSLICLNVTSNFEAYSELYDAKLEIYQIQLSSNTGLLENYTYFIATNCNPFFKNADSLELAVSQIDTIINRQQIDRLTGNFAYNISIDNHSLIGRVGSVGMYNSIPSELSLWKNGEPETITLSISRIALITLKGTETTIFKSPLALSEDTIQLQLEKFGEGFIYNKLVPSSQLSEMDLFQPPA